LSESARPTSGFENALARHTSWPASGLIKTIAAQFVSHNRVNLDGIEAIPLESKRIGIGLRRHKSRKRSHDGNDRATIPTLERAIHNLLRTGNLRRDGFHLEPAAAFEANVYVECASPHLSTDHGMHDYEATETSNKKRTDLKILASHVARETPLRFLSFLPLRDCHHVVYSLNFSSS